MKTIIIGWSNEMRAKNVQTRKNATCLLFARKHFCVTHEILSSHLFKIDLGKITDKEAKIINYFAN